MNLLLTSDQLGALNRELNAVAVRYKERYRGQTGAGVRAVEMQLNLFPVVDAGARIPPKDAS
jgi:hypothetical protein